ncbi:hypothetical protein [Rhodococcus opacus]|nr:hypothetical protein [Rhodococcus opacus]
MFTGCGFRVVRRPRCSVVEHCRYAAVGRSTDLITSHEVGDGPYPQVPTEFWMLAQNVLLDPTE